MLKTALIQHHNKGHCEANLAYIATQIELAAAQGVDLCLLQELHNSAYFCQTQDINNFELAEPLPGPSSTALSKLASRNRMVIIGSIFEKSTADVYYNTALVFENNGDLVGRYRKMHIPQDPGYEEKFYFTPGDEQFKPVSTSVGKLGVMVCWDQWFPEAARLMALAGADLLAYPTAIGWDTAEDAAEQKRQLDAWQIVQRGHAVANGIHLLACNRVGSEAGQQFWGHSFIAGPQGEILAQADTKHEQLLIAEIDLQRSTRVRQIWPFFRDRRIDAYADLTLRNRQD